jgi:hypothetical protein
MAFTTIDPNKIKVGDPITKEVLDLIKSNFDDHEFRINSLSISASGLLFILNDSFSFLNFEISDQSTIFYYTARRDFTINDFRARLFTKGGLTSGVLSFSLEKSTSPEFSSFTEITSSDLSFNFATDANYTEKLASLDTNENSIITGEIIRIRVTSHPALFREPVLISIGGE